MWGLKTAQLSTWKYWTFIVFTSSFFFFFTIYYCKTLYICKPLRHYGEGDKCISRCRVRKQFKCFAFFCSSWSFHVELWNALSYSRLQGSIHSVTLKACGGYWHSSWYKYDKCIVSTLFQNVFSSNMENKFLNTAILMFNVDGLNLHTLLLQNMWLWQQKGHVLNIHTLVLGFLLAPLSHWWSVPADLRSALLLSLSSSVSGAFLFVGVLLFSQLIILSLLAVGLVP